MPVTDFVTGDRFIYRVTKYLSSNPENKWVNTYEFKATETGGEGALLTLGTILVNFEVAMHMSAVIFDRLLISTWEEDSVPYDPASFISTTLTANGGRAGVGNLLPLDKCLSVTRQAASGRFGHIYYRGTLLDTEVAAPAGISVLTDRPGVQDEIETALGNTGLEDYIGNPASEQFQMVMINKTGTQMRNVISLRAQGVADVKPDHRWFNRTTTP